MVAVMVQPLGAEPAPKGLPGGFYGQADRGKDLLPGYFPKAQVSRQAIHAGRDGIAAVNQRHVEIEEDRTNLVFHGLASTRNPLR